MISFFGYFFFSENRIQHFIQIVSNEDDLHDMSNHFFWGKIRKDFNMSSAKKFALSAKC